MNSDKNPTPEVVKADLRETLKDGASSVKLAALIGLRITRPRNTSSQIDLEKLGPALAQLPEDERQAIQFSYDGVTPEEAAGLAGTSVDEMKNRLTKGRAALRRAIGLPAP
jgi:DNA-directed RNA polymerase specialized sigma24 family protein